MFEARTKKEMQYTTNWTEVNENKDDLLLRNTFINAHLSGSEMATKPHKSDKLNGVKWVDGTKEKAVLLADVIKDKEILENNLPHKIKALLKPLIKKSTERDELKNIFVNTPNNKINEYNQKNIADDSSAISRNNKIGKSKSDSNHNAINIQPKSPSYVIARPMVKADTKKKQRPSSVNPRRKQSPATKARKPRVYDAEMLYQQSKKRPIHSKPNKLNRVPKNTGEYSNISNVGGIIMNINPPTKPTEGNYIFPQFIQINNYQAPFPVAKGMGIQLPTVNKDPFGREKAKSFFVNDQLASKIRKPSPSIEQRKLRDAFNSEKKPKKFVPDTNKLMTVSKVYGQKKPHKTPTFA